ncbi:hypothetical protein CTI12_AA620830 [Artemisia annua]|uniref:Uncharacterized protein n=1 Tax=Artemisia annua TaxID=35608 RepID=A0A2U1K9E7_ARTAN|nr:hypothetical protein CTI12_AA620830 [Artemisia annua]
MASSSTAAQIITPFTTSTQPSKTVFFGKGLTNSISFSHKKTFINLSKTRPLRVVAEKVVGIDLGTTNSAVGAMEGGKPVIVTNAEGQRTTPSVVAYTKSGDRLVGQIAKRQAVVNPENTFFSVKRFIGRKMSEVDEEILEVGDGVFEVLSTSGDTHLGGDDFDKVVLEVGDGVFEVLSTSGDTHLGGDDFDKRIVDWLAASFKKDEGIDLLKDKQALQRLTETAEKAKMELSTLTQANISISVNVGLLIGYFSFLLSLPFITATADGPKHIDTTLTRAKFEELCSDLLDSIWETSDSKTNFSVNIWNLFAFNVVIIYHQSITVAFNSCSFQAGVLAGDVSELFLSRCDYHYRSG